MLLDDFRGFHTLAKRLNLKGFVRATYLTLLGEFNESRWADSLNYSIRDLAEVTGIPKSSALIAVHKLKELGLIEVSVSGRARPSVFSLVGHTSERKAVQWPVLNSGIISGHLHARAKKEDKKDNKDFEEPKDSKQKDLNSFKDFKNNIPTTVSKRACAQENPALKLWTEETGRMIFGSLRAELIKLYDENPEIYKEALFEAVRANSRKVVSFNFFLKIYNELLRKKNGSDKKNSKIVENKNLNSKHKEQNPKANSSKNTDSEDRIKNDADDEKRKIEVKRESSDIFGEDPYGLEAYCTTDFGFLYKYFQKEQFPNEEPEEVNQMLVTELATERLEKNKEEIERSGLTERQYAIIRVRLFEAHLECVPRDLKNWEEHWKRKWDPKNDPISRTWLLEWTRVSVFNFIEDWEEDFANGYEEKFIKQRKSVSKENDRAVVDEKNVEKKVGKGLDNSDKTEYNNGRTVQKNCEGGIISEGSQGGSDEGVPRQDKKSEGEMGGSISKEENNNSERKFEGTTEEPKATEITQEEDEGGDNSEKSEGSEQECDDPDHRAGMYSHPEVFDGRDIEYRPKKYHYNFKLFNNVTLRVMLIAAQVLQHRIDGIFNAANERSRVCVELQKRLGVYGKTYVPWSFGCGEKDRLSWLSFGRERMSEDERKVFDSAMQQNNEQIRSQIYDLPTEEELSAFGFYSARSDIPGVSDEVYRGLLVRMWKEVGLEYVMSKLPELSFTKEPGYGRNKHIRIDDTWYKGHYERFKDPEFQ